MEEYYPGYEDINFDKILDKYEFQEKEKHQDTYDNEDIVPIYQEPRQLLIRNLISKNTLYDNILLYWNVGTGKCMKKDTPIIMYDGSIKKVQDIQVGDLLMGDDSKPRTVLSLARGEDKMYDIIPTKGDKYTVNQEHILCLKASGYPLINNKRYKNHSYFVVKWIENNKLQNKSFKYTNENKDEVESSVKQFYDNIQCEQVLEIAVKDYIKLPKNVRTNLKGYRTAIDFEHKDLPFDPYMIGYWLGDGTSRSTSITTQDSTVLHYFNQNLRNYNLMLSKNQDDYAYGIIGYNQKPNSNIFLNTLKELDLINNKHIPMIYKCNSRENRLKLLAGFIDADGHLDKGNTFEITQSKEHEQLMDDIMYLARSLGFACYKKIKKTSWTYNGEKKNGEALRIHLSGNSIEEIPTLIPRKQAQCRKQIKDVLVTGIKAEYVGEDAYYGFTLDGNCRYILGDFTVTHNTCASITIAEGFKEYVLNMRQKILVLVKNANIEKNFKNELLSECSRYAYVNKNQSNFLRRPAMTQMDVLNKAEAMNRITRKINKVYNFMTYGTFVNQVLGMKEFEKDNLGRNTTRQRRNPDGSLARKRPTNPINDLNNTVIIIDEAHNVTNNDVYIALKQVLQRSYNYRLVLLTATPMYDNPKEIIEIANLLNMNNQEKLLPIRNELFKPYKQNKSLMVKGESDYLKSGILKSGLTAVSDLGQEMLIKSLKGKVSYLQANTTDFPAKIDMGEPILTDKKNKIGSIKVVYCNMSEYQNKVYKQALALDLNQTPNQESAELLDAEDNIAEEPVEVQQSSSLYKNSSDAATMSYPGNLFGKDGFEKFLSSEDSKNILDYNGDLRQYSEKLYKLLTNIKNSPGNAFIYSNYVNYGGTSLIKKLLLANGYKQYTGRTQNRVNEYNSFILYDDSTSAEIREAQRKVFNSPDNKDGKYIKIIIGSPVISEGITLKNVRQVHILEPTWNMSRINQIIGRAVRNKSHEALPLTERNVQIYKYCSVHKNTNTYYIDKEKYILAEEKDRSNKVVERLLKQVAFDCNLNLKNGTPYTADCDYMEDCDYKCIMKPPTKRFDKFTYKLYINFFEEFDMEITTNFIKDLYKQYFIYSITDIVNKLKDKEPVIKNETIYNSLKQLIDNKVILLDQYGREGFLIEKGDYIIFNPLDVDINSSLYSKMLDFSVDSNEYSLNEYVKSKLDKNLEVEEDIEEKAKGPKKPQMVHLSSDDLAYNKKIMDNNYVYGSYRTRPTKESGGLFGPDDKKFRIIDLRDIEFDEDDKRKNISGMAATSYNKTQLIDIVEYLKITKKEMETYLKYPSGSIDIKNLDIKQLVIIITKHMEKKKLILK